MSIKVSFDSEHIHLRLSTDDPYSIETVITEFGRLLSESAAIAAGVLADIDGGD